MNFIEHTVNWCTGEIFEGKMIALFGIAAIAISIKVLHHLKKVDLCRSFHTQKEVLNDDGILFHSLWYGNKVEEHHSLLFVYYAEEQIIEMIED